MTVWKPDEDSEIWLRIVERLRTEGQEWGNWTKQWDIVLISPIFSSYQATILIHMLNILIPLQHIFNHSGSMAVCARACVRVQTADRPAVTDCCPLIKLCSIQRKKIWHFIIIYVCAGGFAGLWKGSSGKNTPLLPSCFSPAGVDGAIPQCQNPNLLLLKHSKACLPPWAYIGKRAFFISSCSLIHAAK